MTILLTLIFKNGSGFAENFLHKRLVRSVVRKNIFKFTGKINLLFSCLDLIFFNRKRIHIERVEFRDTKPSTWPLPEMWQRIELGTCSSV